VAIEETLSLVSDSVLQKKIYNNSNYSVIVFVKMNDTASIKALNTLREFFRRDFPEQDILFLVVDVNFNEKFAKSLRISITPTTVVFKGKQKIYEKICQPTLADLRNVLHNL
jgi:hypothetical protein